jgi:hypothetical protein
LFSGVGLPDGSGLLATGFVAEKKPPGQASMSPMTGDPDRNEFSA